jgi:hypothetical protein
MVKVGVGLELSVGLAVKLGVKVFVRVGVKVCAGVELGVKVKDGVRLMVGVRVKVEVGWAETGERAMQKSDKNKRTKKYFFPEKNGYFKPGSLVCLVDSNRWRSYRTNESPGF